MSMLKPQLHHQLNTRPRLNHHPALLFYINGELSTCQVFEIQDGKIHRSYFLRNPDKLAALQESKVVKPSAN